MDERFWDEDGQNAIEEPVQENGEADEDDERKWQNGIIESVLDRRMQSDISDKRNKLV